MRAYSNALKAGVLGLAMLTAAPAFSGSAQAGPAPSVDIAALQQDPVHEAAIKASTEKIIFVIGEGFHKFAISSFKNRLAELGLTENKHYEIRRTGGTFKDIGTIYMGGEFVKLNGETTPFTFTSRESQDAISIIRNAIKTGQITFAALTP